jgi:hypothetical protein
VKAVGVNGVNGALPACVGLRVPHAEDEHEVEDGQPGDFHGRAAASRAGS